LPTITDINAEARKLVDADSVSYTDADLLRRINSSYEEICGKLIALDKNWNFGDSNYISLPTGLSNLTAGTQEYAFNSELLTVIGVSVLDSSSLWHVLTLIDEQAILKSGIDLDEYEKTDGLPWGYAKRENFIVLYPAPSAAKTTLTSGLKVYFQRTADVFTAAQVTTGTKTPGFASPYHYLLSYKAALPYAISYKPERVPMIMAEIARIEKDMIDFYCQRSKDERSILSNKGISFR
jgi:hypothetical protein